jgi:hypothetical protein
MTLWIVVSPLQLGDSIQKAAEEAYKLVLHQTCGVTARQEGATSEQREEEYKSVAKATIKNPNAMKLCDEDYQAYQMLDAVELGNQKLFA